MSKVIVHRNAANYLQRLPKSTKQRIRNILKELEETPLNHPKTKRMLGEWAGYYRIRSGNLRIIYWFDQERDVVYVDYIGPRGDVYK